MTTAPPSQTSYHKYERLAELLRGRIQNGDLVPGDRLPSLTEMRTQYGVTQPTVERAYSLLENDGLIVRQPRRGIFVAKPGLSEEGIPSRNASFGSDESRTLIAVAEPDYAFFDHGVNRLLCQAEAANLELLCYPVNRTVVSTFFHTLSHRKPLGYILFQNFCCHSRGNCRMPEIVSY